MYWESGPSARINQERINASRGSRIPPDRPIMSRSYLLAVVIRDPVDFPFIHFIEQGIIGKIRFHRNHGQVVVLKCPLVRVFSLRLTIKKTAGQPGIIAAPGILPRLELLFPVTVGLAA